MKHKLLKKKLSVTFLSMAMLITALPQFNTPILAQDRWTSGQPTLSPGEPTTPGEPTWTPGEPTTPGEPEETTPDVEFKLSDWEVVENGDTVALVQPSKPIHAKHYYIPSHYDGKRIEIGHEGLFSFGDDFTVAKLQIGSPDEDKVPISKFNDGNSLLFTAIKEKSISMLDLRGLDVSNITDMSNLFSWNENLRTIDLTGWDVSQVEDMSYMFWNCKNLRSINAPNFELKKVKSTQEMFYNCQSLTNLDCENWNLCAALNMNSMFLRCYKLNNIDVLKTWKFNLSEVNPEYNNGKTSSDISGLFAHCADLTNLQAIENWRLRNIENMANMFSYCTSLTSLEPLKEWDISKVKNMSGLFDTCSDLTSLKGLENWDISSVEEINEIFSECIKLKDISALENWSDKTKNIKKLNNVFSLCANLENFDSLKDWDVSNVEEMSKMFSYCPNLKSLNFLEKWNVSKVRDFSGMFIGCLGLNNLEGLENWEPTKVESISKMFALCRNIEDFTAIENWQMPNLYDLRYAFFGCDKLKSLDMSEWQLDLNAEKIDMDSMFNRCTNLQFLDLSLLDNYQGTLVFDSIFNTVGKYKFDISYESATILDLKRLLDIAYPDMDVSEKYPVEIEDYFPGECKDVPLMVLSNREGLENELNNGLANGRVKFAFTVVYNGKEFKTRAVTHDELISASNFVYPNNEAVINYFVDKINDEGSGLVTDPDIEWYWDNDCTKPLNTFDFTQQDNKMLNVFFEPVYAKVSYEFVSAYDDLPVPQGVLDQLPESVMVDLNSTVKPSTSEFKIVNDGLGYWQFAGWDKEQIENIQDEQKFIGTWVYVENAVELNHIPTINASDITLLVGDEFVPLKGVSATDEEDGEIKDIEVIENNVDTSKPGTYQVTYKVVDSLGASRIRTINVIVKLGTEKINHAPIISANDVTLVVGDEFDPLKGVSAHDYEDGAIKDIKVIENNVDTSKAGTYEVVYKVTDRDGASVCKTIKVTVISGEEVVSPPTADCTNPSIYIMTSGLALVAFYLLKKKKIKA